MNKCFQFHVPIETLPALLGINGQKHNDLEKRTNSRLKFEKDGDKGLLVIIYGPLENCRLARALVHIAVSHFQASVAPMSPRKETLGSVHACLDLKTVLFEIYDRKC